MLVFLQQRRKMHVFFKGNEYVQTSARCLQMMLRIDEYRYSFVNIDGIQTYDCSSSGSKVIF